MGPMSSNAFERLELGVPLIGMGRGDDQVSAVVVVGLTGRGRGTGTGDFFSVPARVVGNIAVLDRRELWIGVDSPDTETVEVTAWLGPLRNGLNSQGVSFERNKEVEPL